MGFFNEYIVDEISKHQETVVLGTVSATNTNLQVRFPFNGRITAIKVKNDSTYSAHDTNYYDFGVTNKGDDNNGSTTIVDRTDALNSTKATGGINSGGGLTANVASSLTLSSTDSNMNFSAGDVLSIVTTKNSSASNLAGFTYYIEYLRKN